MKYRGLIFDFDYTLGDSTDGIVMCVNTALERLGYARAKREAVQKTIGLHLEETYRVLTSDVSEHQAAEFAKCFREQADEVMTESSSFYPGVLELLDTWHNQDYYLGIVTTKYHYRIEAILDKYQVSGLFHTIVGGEDVQKPKPDPEGVLKVIEQWKLQKEQILYVGDSLVDAKTAQAAGVDFAGVTTGTTKREELEQYPNVGIAGELRELQRIITHEVFEK